jgi:hypothetical protein
MAEDKLEEALRERVESSLYYDVALMAVVDYTGGIPDSAQMPFSLIRELLICAWLRGMGYGIRLQLAERGETPVSQPGP